MPKNGFSVVGLTILVTIILFAAAYIQHNYNLSISLSPKSLTQKLQDKTPKTETESIPATNPQDLTCGYLGFDSATSPNYTIFSFKEFKKFGKDGLREPVTAENTAKINTALRTVMDETPPKYNPPLTICYTKSDKFLLVIDKKVTLFSFDQEYTLQKTIPINNFSPIYDVLAYTPDKILYLQQSSKDYTSGKMTDGVLKINLNDGAQKLINYSEKTETVGVPQKNLTTQSTTITSKNLNLIFTAPPGVTTSYSPLFDQEIEYVNFTTGSDNLEIMLGKDNPYCKEVGDGGLYSKSKTVKFANKWDVPMVYTYDPRSISANPEVWNGEKLLTDNVCVHLKETLKNKDSGSIFDGIITAVQAP